LSSSKASIAQVFPFDFVFIFCQWFTCDCDFLYRLLMKCIILRREWVLMKFEAL
jgi:hypothetical protein